jgi:hypothetical protein
MTPILSIARCQLRLLGRRPLFLAAGTAMLLVCRQIAGTQAAWNHKRE